MVKKQEYDYEYILRLFDEEISFIQDQVETQQKELDEIKLTVRDLSEKMNQRKKIFFKLKK